jgi:hypothetical protein
MHNTSGRVGPNGKRTTDVLLVRRGVDAAPRRDVEPWSPIHLCRWLPLHSVRMIREPVFLWRRDTTARRLLPAVRQVSRRTAARKRSSAFGVMQSDRMLDRRHFLRTLLAGVLAALFPAEAQQTGKVPRIGTVTANPRVYDDFVDQLRKLGWPFTASSHSSWHRGWRWIPRRSAGVGSDR